LKDGRLFGDGPKEEMLTADLLSGLFGSKIEVARHDGYYHAW
jgi:iron complex transport system ATP-binding protein